MKGVVTSDKLSAVANAVRERTGVGGRITLSDMPALIRGINNSPYTGPYTVTPGDTAVVIGCSGNRMTADVVVNPVPSNYGKISWNGSTLTVS